ncbi:RNA-directed DNA polymerase [Sphingobacterium sp. WM]|uniref:RNA-directed DNA polymerase n=1 Tax=Sphingobacterium sp. WM TaxID=3031802 RepID=UPI00240D903F|nr:RNA-directed DNA polymerase [Sphingobacterium sp. WM]WFB62126.1 RNA-directed DNA polymerase [Sphingobacterium sp. WM]
MSFELKDLLLAYKKAKREVFHQNLHLSKRYFIEFEKSLINKLEKLLICLNSKKLEKFKYLNNSNYFTIIKGISYNKKEDDTVVVSDPKKRWELLEDKVDSIDFRIIPDLDVEIHILSSLWIDFYGNLLEKQLSNNCYGSRIVSSKSSINHFKPYVHEYRLWQQNGIDTIRENFKNKKNVIAITADLNSFYHHVNPQYLNLLNEQFSVKLIPEITDDALFLNEVLKTIITNWSQTVYKQLSEDFKPQFRNTNHVGIPIGLSASKVIANLILKKFDDKVEEELMPVYYGRYVDDIFIVLNNNSKLYNRFEIWNFICKRIEGLTIDYSGIVSYEDEYTEDSSLAFNSKKEKIFILDKLSGEEIIKEIEEELKKNSSEWRFIPETGTDFEKLSEDILFSDGNLKEGINSLRKANSISIKRLKFANYLNKLEEIVRTHPEYYWEEEVKKLVYFVKTFAINPEIISDYTQYIPRVLDLVMYTENYKLFCELSDSLMDSVIGLKKSFKESKYDKEYIKLEEYFKIIIRNSIFTGLKFNKG